MILPIVTYGNPILRKPGHQIKEKTKEIEELIDNMFETLYEADGVGLTATQVDKPLSLFIIDYDNGKETLKEAFINPEVIDIMCEEGYYLEACLSIPDIKEEVKRPSAVKIKYLDRDFNPKEVIYQDVLARIVQHEYDHTQGMLFTDRLAPIKKRLIANKLKAIMKKKFNVDYRTK